MGEIDTKPIESVQTAITFFGQSNEQMITSSTNDKEVEIESLERELASVRVQVEAKEAVHKQALLKLDHYYKTAHELSKLLKNSDVKKNFYINQSEEAISREAELESSLASMARQLADHEHAASELQGEVAALREAEVESLSQMQATEGLLSEERLHNEELSRQTNECLNDLEHRIVEKSANIDSLQLEIEHAKKLLMSSERSASEAVCEVNMLKEEMEMQEKQKLDYMNDLEAEMKQMRSEVESVKTELEKAREQENEAQVEIALLKFQLHKDRSKLAAAEAAEARTQSEKTALYIALQQMGLEAEETMIENRMLKEAAKLADPPVKEEAEIGAEEEGLITSDKELEDVKRELEDALSKIGELRTRAELATTRAEAAEKAKAVLEEQNKKRREHKERRKAALAALRLESVSRELERKSIKDDDDDSTKIYQPLVKVLNMKF